MRYFSTFSGIGGFEVGITNAYENTKNRRVDRNKKKALRMECSRPETRNSSRKHHSLSERSDRHAFDRESPECVGYSEVDKYAIQTYEKNFPNHENYGDITKINERKLPDFDLLVGGFPCQSFSIAGKRGGFSDTRGTLFFDLARILKAKRPRLFIFENVKGLLSHDQGRTFTTIISTLDELGYDCQWQVLNSKDFGVPQNRERVYIIGHIRGTRRPEVFPFGTADEDITSPNENTESMVASTLTARQYANAGGNFVKVAEATKKGYAVAEEGDSINLSVIGSKTRRGRVGKKIAQTLDTGMQQHTLTPQGGVRRLTPRECERLQGFPDDWTEGISDSQRYKCLGNAITTNVVQAVMERICASV